MRLDETEPTVGRTQADGDVVGEVHRGEMLDVARGCSHPLWTERVCGRLSLMVLMMMAARVNLEYDAFVKKRFVELFFYADGGSYGVI